MSHKTTYEYDPRRLRLNVFVDGKPCGGFVGKNAEKQFASLLQSSETSSNQLSFTDMSESIRKAKVRRLRALWIKQGIDDMREAIMEPYGVSSTADLSEEDLDELLERFKPNGNAPASEHVRRLRSHCLDLMTRLGIYQSSGDWARVNEFMMNPRIAGKLLYQLNAVELEALRRKLNSILDKQSRFTEATGNPMLN